ncbi:ATP-dependent Clp protease proteolytic subunit [Rhodococcus sp. 14C212]|uniref:ATP-dependent Clp protease proteolytic subunit n=1 Tax=Rhodococcus sp. 14C212 TaxID=2711209 RepID=UPI0013EA02E1|nr:ATP-dependent Clp protease proteolytic subunit [Rhodococcus sp. 14C212]
MPPWQPEPPPPASAPAQYTSLVARGPDWLAERLFDQRIVRLTGRLDHEAANHAAATLALLDASGDDPVQLWLHDVEADLDTATTLLDTLDLMGVPIRASCLGTLTGAALALLAAADRRTAAPHATFHLREPRTTCDGPAATVDTQVDRYRKQLRALQQRLADVCRRPVEEIAEDMRAHRILTAEQARDYGLIDAIGGDRAPHAP